MNSKQNNKPVAAPKEMGHYQEAPGGGTPLAKGQKAPSKQWVDDNRQMQPRDENGQFTYNAANFKDRKYDYHGKADSDMPWLKGNPSFVTKTGDSAILDGKVYKIEQGMTLKEFSDMYKKYNKWSDNEQTVNAALTAKKGRKSAIVKQQIAAGKEGVVVNPGKGKKATLFEALDSSSFTTRTKRGKRHAPQTPTFVQQKQQPTTPPTNNGGNNNPQPTTPPNNGNGNGNVTPPNVGAKAPVNNNIDANAAKSDPKKFMQDNYEALQEIDQLAKSKGFGSLDMDALVAEIGNGTFKTFDDIKKVINEA